jgi:hypothetical protein
MTEQSNVTEARPDCDICGRPYRVHKTGLGFPMCPISAIGYRPAAAPEKEIVGRLEAHGEALFALSDRLRASRIISASDSVHEAYERVVQTFTALEAARKP